MFSRLRRSRYLELQTNAGEILTSNTQMTCFWREYFHHWASSKVIFPWYNINRLVKATVTFRHFEFVEEVIWSTKLKSFFMP